MCRSILEGGRRCPGGHGKSKAGVPAVKVKSAVKPVNIGTGDVSPIILESTVLEAPVLEAPVVVPTVDVIPEKVLNPDTPAFNSLLTVSPEVWLALPWKERKVVTEEALNELIRVTGCGARFQGWDKATRALGRTFFRSQGFAEPDDVTISLSDVALRNKEPITIADTVAHEVAHSVAGRYAGHGATWKGHFDSVKSLVHLETVHSSVHTSTDFEKEFARKAYEEKKANSLWLGSCPQGHTFGAGREPKGVRVCVKCNNAKLEARVTYERNPARGGSK